MTLDFLSSAVAGFHHCIKNSGNYQSIWLVTAATFSLRSRPNFSFHLFSPLKEFLCGTKFSSDEELKSTVNKWLKTQSEDFYFFWWEKVLKNGDCIEIQSKKDSCKKCELLYWKIHLIHWITSFYIYIYIYTCTYTHTHTHTHIYIYIYMN